MRFALVALAVTALCSAHAPGHHELKHRDFPPEDIIKEVIGPIEDRGLFKRALSKTALYKSGLHPVFDHRLMTLKPSKWTSHRVNVSSVKACQHGQAAWCTNGKMRVHMIKYEDGCAPIPFCTCNNTPAGKQMTSVETAANLWGRIPAGARSFVAALSLLPDTSAHAFTFEQHLAFFGKLAGSPSVFYHETGHSLNLAPFPDFGDSAIWTKDINNDTCVPDSYAQTNEQEDWAQNVVLAAWQHQLHATALPKPTTTPKPACLSHQHHAALSHLSQIKAFHTTCLPATYSKVRSVQSSLNHQATPWAFPKPTAANAANAAAGDAATPSADLHALKPTPGNGAQPSAAV